THRKREDSSEWLQVVDDRRSAERPYVSRRVDGMEPLALEIPDEVSNRVCVDRGQPPRTEAREQHEVESVAVVARRARAQPLLLRGVPLLAEFAERDLDRHDDALAASLAALQLTLLDLRLLERPTGFDVPSVEVHVVGAFERAVQPVRDPSVPRRP